jgi:hypothetical protein
MYMKWCHLLILLCIVPGCGRYYNWAKKSFNQADKRTSCYELIRPYRCSAALHDGFNTVGMFDILWYSDEVRTIYNEFADDRYGVVAANQRAEAAPDKPADQMRLLLASQKSEEKVELVEVVPVAKAPDLNARLIFYLSMTSAEDSIPPLLATANNKQSTWSAVLKQGEEVYPAAEIKKVTLTPELKIFFAHHANRYRDIYRLEFNRYTPEGRDLLPTADNVVCVSLRSVDYEVTFCWDAESCKGVSCNK